MGAASSIASKPVDASDVVDLEAAKAEIAAARVAARDAGFDLATAGAYWGVVVEKADKLPDADLFSKADPYCVARVGPKGSKWADKGKPKRSATVNDNQNPVWNMGFPIPPSDAPLEVTVRVKDADIFSDDFLGEATFELSDCREGPSNLALELKNGDDAAGTLHVVAGPPSVLRAVANAVAPWKDVVPLGDMGEYQEWSVDSAAPPGQPLSVAGPDMPKNLQGVFWLQDQGDSSALMTFGKTGDGGECSTGALNTNAGMANYVVRCAGDRSWAFADRGRSFRFVNLVDFTYKFFFDSTENPTKCQIIPWAQNLGFELSATWLLDFDMHVVEHDKYKNSVTWLRDSYMFGNRVKSVDYHLVQVVDAEGNRLEPAWSDFVAYQSSKAAGTTPGKILFRELKA